MSRTADIADGVKDALNSAPAGTFSESFTATRAYMPEYTLSDIAALTVVVVQRTRRVTHVDRKQDRIEYTIDVAVIQRLDDADNDEIDGLMLLAEEISGYLSGLTVSSAQQTDIRHEPIIGTEFLNESRQFFSLLNLTYTEWESR